MGTDDCGVRRVDRVRAPQTSQRETTLSPKEAQEDAAERETDTDALVALVLGDRPRTRQSGATSTSPARAGLELDALDDRLLDLADREPDA
jgi:hypothetical protein